MEDVSCELRKETSEAEHSVWREHLQRPSDRDKYARIQEKKGAYAAWQSEGENDGKQRVTDHIGLIDLDKDSGFYTKQRGRLLEGL